MELVLSKEAIKQGFRIEKGLVVKYVLDHEGNPIRKRKNWRNRIRSYSRQFIQDRCEKCKSKKNLTVHHIIPLCLGGNGERENCQTLCKDCHRIFHMKNPIKIPKQRKERIPIFEKGRWGEYRLIN